MSRRGKEEQRRWAEDRREKREEAGFYHKELISHNSRDGYTNKKAL